MPDREWNKIQDNNFDNTYFLSFRKGDDVAGVITYENTLTLIEGTYDQLQAITENAYTRLRPSPAPIS